MRRSLYACVATLALIAPGLVLVSAASQAVARPQAAAGPIFDCDGTFTGQTFKHVLVPIWLLSYTYGAKAFQVIANGYTGRIAGRYPKSVWKIALVVLLVAVVVLALIALNNQ